MANFQMLISVVGGHNKQFKMSPDLQTCFSLGFRKVIINTVSTNFESSSEFVFCYTILKATYDLNVYNFLMTDCPNYKTVDHH